MTETCQKMERLVLGRSVFVSRPWKERVKGCLSAKDTVGGGDGGYWKFRFWFKPRNVVSKIALTFYRFMNE